MSVLDNSVSTVFLGQKTRDHTEVRPLARRSIYLLLRGDATALGK